MKRSGAEGWIKGFSPTWRKAYAKQAVVTG